MPRTELIIFSEADGTAPLVVWLDGLQEKAREKCFVRLERLEEMGHELRRPEAENLGEGIYELRVKHQGVNYRMLYFFHGRTVVIVTQGFSKQQAAVPSGEIRLALKRRRAFEADPAQHSFKGDD